MKGRDFDLSAIMVTDLLLRERRAGWKAEAMASMAKRAKMRDIIFLILCACVCV